MKEIVNSLKAIMADRHERAEFIGGAVAVAVILAVCYLLMVMFHSDGLLSVLP